MPLAATLNPESSMLGDQLGLPAEEAEPLHELLPNEEKRVAAKRITERVSITLRPSSSSQRRLEEATGVCKDLSKTGYGTTTDHAPRVGDIYVAEVNGEPGHPLHGLHARCVRCQMIDDDTFDSGFCLLSPIDMQHVIGSEPLI